MSVTTKQEVTLAFVRQNTMAIHVLLVIIIIIIIIL